MNRYLTTCGIAIIVAGVIGGAVYLSVSYDEFQSHILALGVALGTPPTLYDMAKWQFARILGGGIIFGSWIMGSMVAALGWIGGTLEDIRGALVAEAMAVSGTEAPQAVGESKS